ncbi:hypothetical protein PG2089B_1367 [Bifidobacterium pseudolongum subsp. globosum]|uniref:Uncharacterized protein n=1 Tax=Bifidobacterium pseudolongum subsp. globosum TaxID=1690 RepID=A0A4Q5AJD5_9BIFI|nr:hypothetical protein PG2089B_1367 [Bifidobacterium pseudolongum subsp. globosum]RYQ21019.1 hypothetical protein PG2049B_1655 [Bifidobacterium pseudolongum subsp. globosum]RYQ29430.1 hypothetical protein PG2017B_1619 [Bifidobacterium pseudolongum subsp. globosum]
MPLYWLNNQSLKGMQWMIQNSGCRNCSKN